jgi:hypothetical protein
MEPIRRNEISTTPKNLNNSLSRSGEVLSTQLLQCCASTQLFPQERRELHSADLGKDHTEAHEILLTPSLAEHRQSNDEEMYIPKNYETSL